MKIDISNVETGVIDFENTGFLAFFGSSDGDLTINGLYGMLFNFIFKYMNPIDCLILLQSNVLFYLSDNKHTVKYSSERRSH